MYYNARKQSSSMYIFYMEMPRWPGRRGTRLAAGATPWRHDALGGGGGGRRGQAWAAPVGRRRPGIDRVGWRERKVEEDKM